MTRSQFALGPVLLLTMLGVVLGVACWPDPRPMRSTPAAVVTLVIVPPADPTVTPFVFMTVTPAPERLPAIAPTATSIPPVVILDTPEPTMTPPPMLVLPTDTPKPAIQKGELWAF